MHPSSHHCKLSIPLNQGRYTWRHDSVLANIEPVLKKLVDAMNSRKPLSGTEAVRKVFSRSFVRAGTRPVAKHKSSQPGLLSLANDWNLLVDYDHKQITFPPNIYPTSERPDIIIWSRKTQRVVVLKKGFLLLNSENKFASKCSLITSTQEVGKQISSPLKLVLVAS